MNRSLDISFDNDCAVINIHLKYVPRAKLFNVLTGA